MSDIQYFRSDIYSTEQSDKSLGKARDVDGIIVSQEIDSFLDDAKLINSINVPEDESVKGLTCGESIKVFVDSYYPVAALIWENSLSAAVPFFTKENFVQNFYKIIDIYKRAGTIESFEDILRLALYDPTITITQLGNAQFEIEIDQAADGYEMQAVSSDQLVSIGAIKDGVTYSLGGQANQNPLTTHEIMQLIQTLNVHGVEITITFI